MQALFAVASGAYAWGNTPSRRLKLWTDVPPEVRPALFQFEGGTDPYTWRATPADRIRKLVARWFVYLDAKDPSIVASSQINDILDAFDAAMDPPSGNRGLNTLGGTCSMARITGVPLKDPGDLDGDGMIIVEIEITLP